MLLFLEIASPDRLVVRVRAEGEGGTLGDMWDEIGPGDSFADISYETLRALAPGEVDTDNLPQ
jgi:hypothetical protein